VRDTRTLITGAISEKTFNFAHLGAPILYVHNASGRIALSMS
jgi:hypothetical protein